MPLQAGGPRCACGARGCLEALVGTAAILRRARQVMARSRPRTPAEVFAAARRGDAGARRVWRELGASLGVSLGGLINLLNPERIVIGGGVANAWPFFAPAMREAIGQQAFAVPRRAARIVRAQLGEHSGVIGAASLVWEAA